MRRLVILMGLAAALTGCAGGSGVTVSQGAGGMRSAAGGHADYAASLGPLPVVMVNNPFPAPGVLSALQKHNARVMRFTAEPPASLGGGYRLLLGFDHVPPGGLNVCREPVAPSSRPAAGTAARLRVYGAFCVGAVLVSDAVASAPAIQSTDDPGFQRLMGDLLSALMPLRPAPGGDNSR